MPAAILPRLRLRDRLEWRSGVGRWTDVGMRFMRREQLAKIHNHHQYGPMRERPDRT